MVSLKDRRQSGRYTPKATIPPKELLAEGIEIPIEYDDWEDWRDGMRDHYRDGKMIKKIPPKRYNVTGQAKRELLNKKQELLLKRRNVRRG